MIYFSDNRERNFEETRESQTVWNVLILFLFFFFILQNKKTPVNFFSLLLLSHLASSQVSKPTPTPLLRKDSAMFVVLKGF